MVRLMLLVSVKTILNRLSLSGELDVLGGPVKTGKRSEYDVVIIVIFQFTPTGRGGWGSVLRLLFTGENCTPCSFGILLTLLFKFKLSPPYTLL